MDLSVPLGLPGLSTATGPDPNPELLPGVPGLTSDLPHLSGCSWLSLKHNCSTPPGCSLELGCWEEHQGHQARTLPGESGRSGAAPTVDIGHLPGDCGLDWGQCRAHQAHGQAGQHCSVKLQLRQRKKHDNLSQKPFQQAGFRPDSGLLAAQHCWGPSPHGQQQDEDHPWLDWPHLPPKEEMLSGLFTRAFSEPWT